MCLAWGIADNNLNLTTMVKTHGSTLYVMNLYRRPFLRISHNEPARSDHPLTFLYVIKRRELEFIKTPVNEECNRHLHNTRRS